MLFFYFAIVRGVFLRDVEEEKIKGVEKSQRVLCRVGQSEQKCARKIGAAKIARAPPLLRALAGGVNGAKVVLGLCH